MKCIILFRYYQHIQSVARCTSDVIQEKKEREEKRTENTQVKSLQEAVAKLEEELRKHNRDMKELERKIKDKDCELQNHIAHTSEKQSGIWMHLLQFIAMTDPADTAKTESLNADLSYLTSEKDDLQARKQTIQVKLTDLQLKLSTSRTQPGERC